MSSKQVGDTAKRRPPNAGKGRPKGSVNKTTASAKEAFALAAKGLGGAKALEAWAREYPTEFWKLYARLIPTEVAAGEGSTIAGVVILPAVQS